MTAPVNELLQSYKATAVAWDVMRGDAKKANALFDQLHTIYKELRDSAAGRDGIAALMTDENIGVRISAASHSLAWEPEKATRVLEAIEKDGPGLYRTSARYTLKSFREGKLNLDW